MFQVGFMAMCPGSKLIRENEMIKVEKKWECNGKTKIDKNV